MFSVTASRYTLSGNRNYTLENSIWPKDLKRYQNVTRLNEHSRRNTTNLRSTAIKPVPNTAPSQNTFWSVSFQPPWNIDVNMDSFARQCTHLLWNGTDELMFFALFPQIQHVQRNVLFCNINILSKFTEAPQWSTVIQSTKHLLFGVIALMITLPCVGFYTRVLITSMLIKE